MATFKITRGDTAPALRYIPPAGVTLNGTAVFNMPPILDRAPAQIVDGELQYDWQDGDTAMTGLRRAEFEVTYVDGKVETFNTTQDSGPLAVLIEDDLDVTPEAIDQTGVIVW